MVEGRSLARDEDGARASPRVLVLGAYAALRVRGGALEIEHGPHDDRQTIRIDINSEPKPHTILFDSHGEFLTGEAIRWCARYFINLVLPGGPGRLISFVESALETKTNTMTRMRAIDPMIIRAQCAAEAVMVAREIVRAKIATGLKLTMTDADARRRAAGEWEAKLQAARSVAEIMIVEGSAAAAYWRCFKDAGLRERKNGNLPRFIAGDKTDRVCRGVDLLYVDVIVRRYQAATAEPEILAETASRSTRGQPRDRSFDLNHNPAGCTLVSIQISR